MFIAVAELNAQFCLVSGVSETEKCAFLRFAMSSYTFSVALQKLCRPICASFFSVTYTALLLCNTSYYVCVI